MAAGVAVDWDEHLAGRAALEPAARRRCRPRRLQSVRAPGLAALEDEGFSPAPDPDVQLGKHRKETTNFNVLFRRELGLFASVRPLKNLPSLPARFQGVDMLVVRELTEDLYTAVEHEIVPGVVQSLKIVTEAASRRFFRFAFEWARTAGRKTLTCVHKANILKLADGLFLDAFRSVAVDFPQLQAREIIVDNCCMQMVSKPQQFDVLVMGNLYGDIVSDLGAGVVGGISATHAINVGEGIRVYDCIHGGNRSDIGENKANPLPLLMPALDLLEATGHAAPAKRIAAAAERVLTERKTLTHDLGGQATTAKMAEAIIASL